MADTLNKAKLQLRSGAAVTSDKAPSPAAKLLLNHGKPNFTIARSPKVQQNGDSNPLSPQLEAINNSKNNNNNNNNENGFKNANIKTNEIVVSSTKFNGVFKPTKIAFTEKQPHQQNSTENEAAKVVLRRTKVLELPLQDDEDASVPEFIRRQRRIQERLAKENILDFDNRRSGYFTHVLISPTSANRTSFVETMSSPAVVPSLEMPAPQAARRTETVFEEAEHTIVEQEERSFTKEHIAEGKSTVVEEHTIVQESSSVVGTKSSTTVEEHTVVVKSAESAEAAVAQATTTSNSETNGHTQEEEEVARAIEEVNKAVAGEEEDGEHDVEIVPVPVAVTSTQVETTSGTGAEVVKTQQQEQRATTTTSSSTSSTTTTTETIVVETHEHHEHHEVIESQQIVHAKVAVATLEQQETIKENGHTETVQKLVENGQVETVEKVLVEQTNGHATNGHHESGGVTISHTNGSVGPCIPAADPSGALGVNFEPKTVVSFSKELTSEPNNYPDTVKIVKEGETVVEVVDEELKNLTKLKFEIKGEEQELEVTPVLKTEI